MWQGVREAHLEDGLAKRVGQNTQAASLSNANLHLEQTNLIERASEDINDVRAGDATRGQSLGKKRHACGQRAGRVRN